MGMDLSTTRGTSDLIRRKQRRGTRRDSRIWIDGSLLATNPADAIPSLSAECCARRQSRCKIERG